MNVEDDIEDILELIIDYKTCLSQTSFIFFIKVIFAGRSHIFFYICSTVLCISRSHSFIVLKTTLHQLNDYMKLLCIIILIYC